MAAHITKLSNPFSTGGGGYVFENNIQAAFVTLMLSGGYAPCLPPWPIVGIRLQGKEADYATDDLIVFIKKPGYKERRRLLVQAKHSIFITAAPSNKAFKDFVRGAWNDFNNTEVFTKGKDVIALMTGPISKTDTDGVNVLLEHARHAVNAKELLEKVYRANFCANNVRNKLNAFRAQLKIANNGVEVADEDLHEFLKSFHLLGYDLVRKGSVTLSLLESHIGQFNKDIPHQIWCHIVDEVRHFNKDAGTITIDTLSEELVKYFEEPKITHMPKDLVKEDTKGTPSDQPVATNRKDHLFPQKLALANLIGSWDKNNKSDIDVVTQIVGRDYGDWISDLQKASLTHDYPLVHKNGLWTFKDRAKFWKELGGSISDERLDIFKIAVLEVLQTDDPSFELPSDERYIAPIYGKVSPCSDNLREGLAETLVLMSNQSSSLTHCSQRKAKSITLLVMRQLFKDSNWIRWRSLDDLLPTLSEVSPNEFLNAVKNAIDLKPSPFDVLFRQEDTGGIFITNHMTGLLWALQGIAWDKDYLSRAAIALAEIASHDPDGNWTNNPGNSLTDIFLPWLPHTLASVKKRQVAIQYICDEQKEVGWKLLESLLPNKHSSTSGTHKPNWRLSIPDDWGKGVTSKEYWEQSRFCAGLIVEQAAFDIDKLTSLVANYNHLPSPASEELRDKLLSERCINLSEEERMPLWVALRKLIAHNRRFPEAEWSLEDKSLLMLEDIANKFAPKSTNLLNKQLFSEADDYLYGGDGDWDKKLEKLLKRRKATIKNILDEGGLSRVVEFALTVSSPYLVGDVLAYFDQDEFDLGILPSLLDKSDHKQWLFVAAYVRHRKYIGDWEWLDDIDKTAWNPQQIALLLCELPFEKNAWDRATNLLGENEREYWENVSLNAYQAKDYAEPAFIKLLKFGRPDTVIIGLGLDLSHNKDINTDLACDALLALAKSVELRKKTGSYYTTKIIKALQQNKATDQDKLLNVEWAYLDSLSWSSASDLITLENKLASDPNFFCALIILIYPAEGAEPDGSLSEQQRDEAGRIYRLLSVWKVVPGTQRYKKFVPDLFLTWLSDVEKTTKESGHYNVAMTHLGNVLVHAPKKPDGLLIHPVIAEAMDKKERSSLRDAYKYAIIKSDGINWVGPETGLEQVRAKQYRQQADEVENAGYYRLAQTLLDIALYYERDV